MQTTQPAVRPFHETIVEAIRTCGPASTGRIFLLTRLIRDTKIPKGHDEILAAIDEFFDFPGSNKYARDLREVRESLLAQKEAVTKKAGVSETKEVDLNYLQWEAQKLHFCLNDRKPDSAEWKKSLQEIIETMHKLTAQALGK